MPRSLTPSIDRRAAFAALTVAMTGVGTSAPAAPADESTAIISAVIRDFARGDLPGGHPDFNTSGANDRDGLIFGMVEQRLGADGRPVFAAVRPVNDEGNDPLNGEADFDQWYRDVPGVNDSRVIEIGLGPRADDPTILTTQGYNDNFRTFSYFPIDDEGFGNQGHPHNYGFTTQMSVPFSYVAGGELNFSGDDDVWAFINGKLAIDLGGVHRIVASRVILLDGKMFVETANIPVGGIVNEVDAAYRSRLDADWTRLGFTEPLPIEAGTHGWVDLGLGLDDDSRAVFSSDALNATVWAAGPDPAHVRLVFDNGQAEIQAWRGDGVAYAGTGAANGRPVLSIDLILADGTTTTYSAAGRVGADCQLDFFHAERHAIQSNFLLETTLLGVAGERAVFTGYD